MDKWQMCCATRREPKATVQFYLYLDLLSIFVLFLEVLSFESSARSYTLVLKYEIFTAGLHCAQPFLEQKLLHLFTVSVLRQKRTGDLVVYDSYVQD